jgi:hypothetical protein
MGNVPGVSMMLIAKLSFSVGSSVPVASFAGAGETQSQKVAADWIVIPFSLSNSIESILAPTPSLPLTSWISLTRPV